MKHEICTATNLPKTRPAKGRKAHSLMALALSGVLLATGCVTDSNSYSRQSVGVPSEILTGRLVGSEPVRIDGSRSGAGALSGAALGGALGSQVGRNRRYGRGNVAGAIGFAVLGGLVGAAIEEGATGGDGFRYLIELEDGRRVSVVQRDNNPVARVGDPVRVEYGRIVRVLPG